MPKGTSRAEVTSDSEKIKPVALVVIELRLSEGIRQLVSQSIGRSVSQSDGQSINQSVRQSVSQYKILLQIYLNSVAT